MNCAEAHFSRVDLLVTDMKASLAFYRLLGFCFPEGSDTQDYVEVKTHHGFRVSWCRRDIVDSLIPGSVRPTGHRVELSFRCPGRDGVDATHQRLISAGYRSIRAPFDTPWNQYYALVEDPDCNLVALEAYNG